MARHLATAKNESVLTGFDRIGITASGGVPQATANLPAQQTATMDTNNKLLNWAIGIGLLFPLFFQFSGGIYNDFRSDSGGNVATLPLPIAVLACFGGIVLLRRHLRQAGIAGTFIAAMLGVMLLSVVFAGSKFNIDRQKLLLMAQFLMPMAALILGQMISDDDRVIPRAFLVVLLVVVPAQLIAGWIQGSLTLTHSLYVFSIYQHFQYVPLIFVAAYCYATAALWNAHRVLLLVLFPFMAIYAMASGSFLTIGAFAIFGVAFAGIALRASKRVHGTLVSVILVSVIAFAAMGFGKFLEAAKAHSNIQESTPAGYLAKFHALAEARLPVNVAERLADWTVFGNGIIESSRSFLFGHAEPVARAVRTSAHNWYIDIAYTFGLISVVPIAVLMCYTVHLLRATRIALTPDTLWLAAIVIFLVVIDSNFKVTLRQPYSGIFTYFLWGRLLTVLLRSRRLSAGA